MYSQRIKERVRIFECKTEVPMETFLKEVAGRDDKGIPPMSSHIGGFETRFLLGTDLLNFHAAYIDDEADNGPYLFAITKDGTVAWPTNKIWIDLQAAIADSMSEIAFNEEIITVGHVQDNTIVCIGALRFGLLDDPRKGEHVIVESYYLYPTLD